MEPFRYHVFACDQQKPEGVPCCAARGSGQVLEALRREVAARGLEDEVQVTACGSLGLCEHGPNLVVYPEGTWYSGVTPADVPEIVRSHFQEDTPVERLVRTDPAALRAEIVGNREKMMAGRRAREAAGVLPDDLNDRIRGFQESRVVLTALELDLFTAVGEGAAAEEVAAKLHTHPRSTETLLNALASLNLLAKREGVFHNSPEAARYFAAGSRDNARPALLHTAHLWQRWSTLTDCVRAGTAVAGDEIAGRGQDWTEAFIAAMHRNASERAPLVVRAVGVENVRRMLDVGGGSGAYSIAFARANSALRADILDLAAVEPIARRHILEAGVADRVQVRAGDLRSDRLVGPGARPGEGYDLVFLSAICHMLDPAENLDLLRRCREALAPGGRVVIQDFILEADKTAPRFAALFALNMLVGTRGGSSYSEPEYVAWLGEAGFREIRRARLPGITGLMIGSRP
jgi:(2Fe-2S) ferredoxin/predicted O-methyltransferase YrrM